MSETELPHSSLEEPVESLERRVFRDLAPRVAQFDPPCPTGPGSFRKRVFSSIPLIMTGTLATGVIATPGIASLAPGETESAGGNTQQSDARPSFSDRLQTAFLPIAQGILSATGSEVPATYAVQSGDSVSGIADRFGIPTPAILTLNGLGWDAVVHEGQILKLTPEPTKKRQASPARVLGDGYLVQHGETASEIADRLGISTEALLEHNDLGKGAVIYAGQFISLPGVTKDVVSRDAVSPAPVFPTIIAASLESTEAATATEDDAEPSPAFDSADLELLESPALITVKVPEKKVVAKVTPTPAAPAPVAASPAPSSPSPSAAEVLEPEEEAAAPNGVGQPVSGSITPLNDERRGNAQIIIDVGRELGVPDYGIVIALATAMQESSLRNINWGDRDSVGLYQQRPSTGWGTVEELLDPA
ncbi:MAG: LysM peptidoglycan-binding domain-containing protein, partial [Pontimonas sp.]